MARWMAEDLEAVVAGVLDLAIAVQAVAGFIALEPSHGLVHRAAVAASSALVSTSFGARAPS